MAAFSEGGVTWEGIVEAAKENYRTLLQARAGTLSLQEGEEREKSA